jgi:[ribosomal protein S5]-alanine N-acetyltransferase
MTIIDTEKLKLRALAHSDAAVIAREVGNFNVSRNLARVPYPYSMTEALDFLEWIKTYDEKSLICAIELKSAPGELIGVISYEFSTAEAVAELGYWFAERYWGNGFGSEAASAMVRHAFTQGVHARMVASYHNDNPASARILLNLGFKPISHEKHYSKAQGIDVSSTKLSLTRIQWLARETSTA